MENALEASQDAELMPEVVAGHDECPSYTYGIRHRRNLRQAEELIRRRQLTEAVAIDDPEPLRGSDAPDIIVTGTFIARRNVQAFYDLFRAIRAKHRFLA